LDICWFLSLLVRFCNLKLTLAESMLKTYMFLCSGYLVHPKLLKLLLSSPYTWQDPVIVLTTKLIFPKQILCCELLLKILKIFCNSSVTSKIVYLLEALNYISLFLYFSQGSSEMDFFRMLTDTIFRKSSTKGSYNVVCSDIDQYTSDNVAIKKIHNICETCLMLPGFSVRLYYYGYLGILI
jgi:hypothetical protein